MLWECGSNTRDLVPTGLTQLVSAGAVGLGASAAILWRKVLPRAAGGSEAVDEGEDHLLVNWSGTHECRPRVLAQPESLEELERLVAKAHAEGGAPACEQRMHMTGSSSSHTRPWHAACECVWVCS